MLMESYLNNMVITNSLKKQLIETQKYIGFRYLFVNTTDKCHLSSPKRFAILWCYIVYLNVVVNGY